MHKRRRSFESLRAGRRAEVNFASNSITLSRSSLSYREYQLRDVDSSDHLFSQNQSQVYVTPLSLGICLRHVWIFLVTYVNC